MGAWIGDRAVEAGAEPYEVEGAAMYAAVALCLAFFEVRAQRRRRRERDSMRAFRVQRDKITGKQKMVPMTEEEVKALMTKGVVEFEKDKVKKDSKDTETTAARDGGEVPKGLGGVRAAGGGEGCRRTEEEVADLVGAVTGSEPVLDDDARDPSNEPKPPTPPVPVAATSAPAAKRARPRRIRDARRQRETNAGRGPIGITLFTQCACFITAPALAGGTVPNLFAPVVSGLACDLLFIAHQRLAMRRLFADADCEMPGGFKPPRDAEIKKAQMKLLKKDLDRRRRVMASRLMESVDNSVAEGAKEFNIQMREVVDEVRKAKGYTRQDDALTEVLDAIHKKFPPSKLAAMDEAESVAKMRSVLVEIRDELANPKTAEEKEAERVAVAKAELEKDPIDREPWRSLEKTLVEDQRLTHEEARDKMNGVMKKIEEGAAANLERAKRRGSRRGRREGRRRRRRSRSATSPSWPNRPASCHRPGRSSSRLARRRRLRLRPRLRRRRWKTRTRRRSPPASSRPRSRRWTGSRRPSTRSSGRRRRTS